MTRRKVCCFALCFGRSHVKAHGNQLVKGIFIHIQIAEADAVDNLIHAGGRGFFHNGFRRSVAGGFTGSFPGAARKTHTHGRGYVGFGPLAPFTGGQSLIGGDDAEGAIAVFDDFAVNGTAVDLEVGNEEESSTIHSPPFSTVRLMAL